MLYVQNYLITLCIVFNMFCQVYDAGSWTLKLYAFESIFVIHIPGPEAALEHPEAEYTTLCNFPVEHDTIWFNSTM